MLCFVDTTGSPALFFFLKGNRGGIDLLRRGNVGRGNGKNGLRKYGKMCLFFSFRNKDKSVY